MKSVKGIVIGISIVLLVNLGLKGESCQRPLPWHKQYCLEMEQTILESTVRIALHGWVEVENGYEVERIKGTISHATVIDGRYLITHNHFGIPLSQVLLYNQYALGEFTGVSVFRLDGTSILDRAPIESFVVVAEQGETTVLDFGADFFTQLGVRSAKVMSETAVALQPGMEVAQVDWDRQGHTRVVWTEIDTVYAQNNLPIMQVQHFIELGASGGGVFVNGIHIGNNWGRIIETNQLTGQTSQNLSLVALNTALLTTLQ